MLNDKLLRKIWGRVWIATILLLLLPERYTLVRLMLVLGLFGLWVGALLIYRKSIGVKIVCAAIAGLVLVVALVPGRPADPAVMRTAYINSLRFYTGTPYFWGGSSKLAIDCSGLVRAGMIDANLKTGVQTANMALVRRGLSLWWHNCSASQLDDGYGGRVAVVASALSVNEIDYGNTKPGDIIVTSTRSHTMAYLGDHEWIEADPIFGRTIIVRVPDQKNGFFLEPVDVLRWNELRD